VNEPVYPTYPTVTALHEGFQRIDFNDFREVLKYMLRDYDLHENYVRQKWDEFQDNPLGFCATFTAGRRGNPGEMLVGLALHKAGATPIGWARAGGDCVCEICDKTYYDHPHSFEFICMIEGVPRPILHRLCDGRAVKL
jgi:hypothetical protein